MVIDELLNKHFDIGEYTIKFELVSTSGRVLLKTKVSELPVKFDKVGGSFDCSRNVLTSLKGAPQFVGRSFSCRQNPLTSLEGAPESIGDTFYCDWNETLPMLRLDTKM
jgi:hypothetical protein